MRRQRYGLYKTSPSPLEHTLEVMDHAGIDKSVLLPLDLTTITGEVVISNDEVRTLVSLAPDRFVGSLPWILTGRMLRSSLSGASKTLDSRS